MFKQLKVINYKRYHAPCQVNYPAAELRGMGNDFLKVHNEFLWGYRSIRKIICYRCLQDHVSDFNTKI